MYQYILIGFTPLTQRLWRNRSTKKLLIKLMIKCNVSESVLMCWEKVLGSMQPQYDD